MNYKKIILVGFISAFVAVLTSVMGVAGTIIGSVISSVLYNMLTEALEKPMNRASLSADFEWDVAYVFPLIVIALIQLLLIFALLAEFGILPNTFLNAYLSLQNFADNNLYRLLGVALLIISVYPLVLKPDFVKKEHGIIIAGVGLIFLARGFVDLGNSITNIYDIIFIDFDLPIAIIAFILLVFVIYRILHSARQAEKEFKGVQTSSNSYVNDESQIRRHYQPSRQQPVDYAPEPGRVNKKNIKSVRNIRQNLSDTSNVRFNTRVGVEKSQKDINNHAEVEKPQKNINKSSDNIQFESNDLLDDYKK